METVLKYVVSMQPVAQWTRTFVEPRCNRSGGDKECQGWRSGRQCRHTINVRRVTCNPVATEHAVLPHALQADRNCCSQRVFEKFATTERYIHRQPARPVGNKDPVSGPTDACWLQRFIHMLLQCKQHFSIIRGYGGEKD